MPKMKTHKATVKRLKVTGSGKIVRRRAGAAHLLSKKSSKRKRLHQILKVVAAVDRSRYAKLIGPGGEL
jgi:large subunit ribosomal protein L35